MLLTTYHTGVCLALLIGADPLPIGFVLEVNGAWEEVANEPRRIKDGDRLLPGTKIRRVESVAKAPTDSLTFVLYNGQTKVYREAVTLPVGREPALVNRLWTAVLGHYRHGYASAISRGQDGLMDGVLGLSEETVDLASLFADIVDGSYRIELRWAEKRATANDETVDWTFVNEPVKSMSVEWRVKRPSRINVGGLKQGLYEVTLLDNRNPREEKTVSSSAWVLICNTNDFAEVAKAYSDAVRLTESWDTKEVATVSPSAKRAFLRAYLISRRDEQKP